MVKIVKLSTFQTLFRTRKNFSNKNMDSKPVFTSVAETKAQIEKYFYRVEVIERNLASQGKVFSWEDFLYSFYLQKCLTKREGPWRMSCEICEMFLILLKLLSRNWILKVLMVSPLELSLCSSSSASMVSIESSCWSTQIINSCVILTWFWLRGWLGLF